MKKKKIILFSLFFLFLSFCIWSFYPIFTYQKDYKNSPGSIYITDRFGKLLTDKQKKGGYYKYYNTDLNSEFVKSLLKIEDKNYYSHFGVDIFAKFRALKNNLSGNKLSGGSTITEQYIKNKYFKSQKRTYFQKLREASIAFLFNFYIPKNFITNPDFVFSNKDLILKEYLNNVYFGNQIYGIGGAMEVYFGKKDINNLTKEEITLLLSLIHNPGIKSLEERNFREYFNIVKKRLGYTFKRNIFRLEKKQNIDKFPFVTQRILEQKDFSNLDNITFKSTIDLELQSFARSMLNETLNSLKGKM